VNIHLWRNTIIFAASLAFWLLLITIEVLFGYSGIVLQALYGILLFGLLIGLWLGNRPLFATIKNPFFRFCAGGVLAFSIWTLFLFCAINFGIVFKRAIA
jgi:hypothetical protein